MSLQRLIINTGDLSVDGFKSVCDLSPGQLPAANNFVDYISALTGGNQMALLSFNVGAVQSVGTLRVAAGGSANDQACTILNVTFTGKTSSVAQGEFTVSATAATQAQNMVDAVNRSTALAGKVTATRNAGDVIITCVVPGLMGNGLQLSAGNLGNTTVQAAFAGGTDGTAYSLDLR